MISYQLYSSRDHGPLDDTLAMLSRLGYGAVEGFGDLFEDAPSLRGALDEAGLAMPTAHMGLERMEDAPAAAAAARLLGIETLYVPAPPEGMREMDAAGWEAFARRLGDMRRRLEGEGVRAGYHNHHWEFADLGIPERPIDLIVGLGGLDWEMDVAWLVRAGEDPATWIARHAGAISAVHVKDIAPDGEAEDEAGWADPGHGTMGWAALAEALRGSAARRYVMEHDDPSDDARFARRAMETGIALGLRA